MDEILPIWATPHRFFQLQERQPSVFTFGLVLTELHLLSHPDGVRIFGQRYGFEWLSGLARGVHGESARRSRRGAEVTPKLPPIELETFLLDAHGILGPNHFELERWSAATETPAGEPPDDVLADFATRYGVHVKRWARNAFSMLELRLREWAEARERIPRGYEQVAQRRLALTQMPHTLQSVNGVDGSYWTRGYTSLYERVALEFEDLALRRPKPRLCPLCGRAYIFVRAGQAICGNQIWNASSRKVVRRCVPLTETAVYDAAEAAAYERRRKTRWTAMNRVRRKYGPDDEVTREAIEEWKQWRRDNPPPRLPGRPHKAASTEPPFRPVGRPKKTGTG